jgi:hypothetical protein
MYRYYTARSPLAKVRQVMPSKASAAMGHWCWGGHVVAGSSSRTVTWWVAERVYSRHRIAAARVPENKSLLRQGTDTATGGSWS